eukprot:PITA_25676
MVEEYDSIVRNSVWDMVLRPKDKSLLRSCWIYKVKQATDGSVEKHKDIFVACGFSQLEGIEYDEIFAPIASKPMDTPLTGNWSKEDAISGEVVEATIYRQLVGSQMYLVSTQPDMCYAVDQLNQAMVRPTKLYWNASKHVLRYLRGTSQYGLW